MAGTPTPRFIINRNTLMTRLWLMYTEEDIEPSQTSTLALITAAIDEGFERSRAAIRAAEKGKTAQSEFCGVLNQR